MIDVLTFILKRKTTGRLIEGHIKTTDRKDPIFSLCKRGGTQSRNSER